MRMSVLLNAVLFNYGQAKCGLRRTGTSRSNAQALFGFTRAYTCRYPKLRGVYGILMAHGFNIHSIISGYTGILQNQNLIQLQLQFHI